MRLTCGTCGAEFDVDPERAVDGDAVDCASCGSSVPIQTAVLELAVEDLPALASEAPGNPSATEFETFELAAPVHVPAPRAPKAQKPAPRIDTTRTSYRVSSQSAGSSRSGAGWAVFVALLTVAALYIVQRRSRPSPPQIGNPMHAAVEQWQRDDEIEPLPVEQAVKEARAALAGDRNERIAAYRRIKRGLADDPDSFAAVALYAEALAFVPGARNQERVALALRAITAAIGRGPAPEEHLNLEVARAWLLLESDQLDPAREAALRAVELSPLSREARLVLAAADSKVRPERSIPALEELAEDPELGALATRWLAFARVRSGQVAEGLSLLERSVESASNADELKRALYELEFAIGAADKAVAFLGDLTSSGRASLEDRIRFARHLSRVKGRTEQALDVLNGALGEEAGKTLSVGQVYAEMVSIASTAEAFIPDPRELSAWLQKGLALDPDLPTLLYGSTLVDLALDRDEAALDNLEVANGLHPDVPEMAVHLAWRLRQADPEAAREVVDDALATHATSIPLFVMSAVLSFDQGRKVQAFREIRRALGIDPEVAIQNSMTRPFPAPYAVYRSIGDELLAHGKKSRNAVTLSGAAAAYYVSRDFRRASRALVSAMRLDRREATANLYTGILALRRNQKSAARRAFKIAWEQDRTLPLVQLYQARMHEALGDHSRAEQLFRELLNVNTSSSPARAGLARTLWRVGKKSEALDEARKVLEVSPDNREALSFLATLNQEPPPRRRRP
ncbi:MAG: tetratricopeptide repeat protein [Myxococcota bacterium]